jgi:hypothetical protein
MRTEHGLSEAKIVETAVRGDANALAFLRAMARVLHFWDDAIDRDKNVDDACVHARMWDALVTLPDNAFYRQNQDVLQPILVLAIANWRIANMIERNPVHTRADLLWAFVVRSTYVDLVTMSAVIVGGLEHAVHCGPEIRRWAHAEGFENYLTNLASEVAARKENGNVLS